MKLFLAVFLLTISTLTMAQNPQATSVRNTFSLQTTVQIDIDADAATVWALLTNGADYPRWNSTVTSLEGEIKPGEKIRLKSYLDDKRVFKLKVKEMEAEKRLVWGDGSGTRVFTLTANSGGGVTFHMSEKIGGVMFPLYAGYLPPLEESFEKFAADLKREAELMGRGR